MPFIIPRPHTVGLGGWVIATVAWLVSGSHSITGSVMIIWMLAFVVDTEQLRPLYRCQRKCLRPSAARLPGPLSQWFLPAVATRNIYGSVGMVTLLEYGQVIVAEDAEAARQAGHPRVNRRRRIGVDATFRRLAPV